jgi:alkanesulfonate monooxygenase SsuD/methylene tetrahydromethanopterin reductase-like flavin-dependent oxidoreductase (luciferase family)
MQLGVNVPNFGPGTDPGVLREWARIVEGLGFDLLMVSDHVAVTPDVAEQYPEPFYEPFTALSWLAGVTTQLRLGTSVLVMPYRHPLLVARMAANLDRISDGRLVLGVGVGWARQEFEALGVPFTRRGRLTEEYLAALRDAWHEESDGPTPSVPTMPWLRSAVANHSLPGFAPRIELRLTTEPVDDPDRLAGVGTIEQILEDLDELRRLGADTVVLDPYHEDPEETRRPHVAWQALTAVATHWRTRS